MEVFSLGLILVLLFVLGVVLFSFNEYKKNTQKEMDLLMGTVKNLSVKPANNFENDINFLKEIIAHHISIIVTFNLKPKKTAGQKIINDDLFISLREELSLKTISSLSENYKKNLLLYFSEDALYEYVIETINIILVKELLQLQMQITK